MQPRSGPGAAEALCSLPHVFSSHFFTISSYKLAAVYSGLANQPAERHSGGGARKRAELRSEWHTQQRRWGGCRWRPAQTAVRAPSASSRGCRVAECERAAHHEYGQETASQRRVLAGWSGWWRLPSKGQTPACAGMYYSADDPTGPVLSVHGSAMLRARMRNCRASPCGNCPQYDFLYGGCLQSEHADHATRGAGWVERDSALVQHAATWIWPPRTAMLQTH